MPEQRVYATASDYAEFTVATDLSDTAVVKLCRRASDVIDGLTRYARFDVDADGYPTDTDISRAFTRATCAQVEYWDPKDGDTTGHDVDISGARSNEGAVRIGSVTLGTTSSRESGTSRRDARVAPEAVEILQNAGIYTIAANH